MKRDDCHKIEVKIESDETTTSSAEDHVGPACDATSSNRVIVVKLPKAMVKKGNIVYFVDHVGAQKSLWNTQASYSRRVQSECEKSKHMPSMTAVEVRELQN